MPNLLFALACDRVIIDQNGNLSLITVIEEIRLQTVGGAAFPKDAASVPWQWYAVTQWEQGGGYDSGRTFEQRIALIAETGETLLEAYASWVFEKPRHRVISAIAVMPIRNPGKHRLKVFVREKTETPKEWKEAASIPLEIRIESIAAVPVPQ